MARPVVRISADDRPVAEVDDRYLSFCIDLGQIAQPTRFWNPDGTGETTGRASYDFGRLRLRNLTAALAPAFLRIGGTEADRVSYALDIVDINADVPKPPAPFVSVLSAAQVDAIGEFCQHLGLDIAFCLNAGWGCRAADGSWRADAARLLMRYVRERAYPFAVWELGNEPNAWPLFQQNLFVEPEEYARDLAELAAARDAESPGALISGVGTAFWPNVGEFPVLQLRPLRYLSGFLPGVLAACSERALPDVLSWHYYPGLSHRSLLAKHRDHVLAIAALSWAPAFLLPERLADVVDAGDPFITVLRVCLVSMASLSTAIAILLRLLVRPIKPHTLQTPEVLDTVKHWAEQVISAVDATDSKKRPQLWLGETGSAQVGGEPGVSGRWGSTLWWLDQLGTLALLGHRVQCRQTLSGSDYGLIAEDTLAPTPDFWASVLWKRLMGRYVYAVRADGAPRGLRLYCHEGTRGRTFLAINLGKVAVELLLPCAALVWLLDASALDSPIVTINGVVAEAASDGTVPEWLGHPSERPTVPPGTAVFALVPLGAASNVSSG